MNELDETRRMWMGLPVPPGGINVTDQSELHVVTEATTSETDEDDNPIDDNGEVTKEWVEYLVCKVYEDMQSKLERVVNSVNTLIDSFNDYARKFGNFKEYIDRAIDYLLPCTARVNALEQWMTQLEEELALRGIDIDDNLKMLFDEFEVGDNDGS